MTGEAIPLFYFTFFPIANAKMIWDHHINHLFYDPGIVCHNRNSKNM
jgi:hypothetical protein